MYVLYDMPCQVEGAEAPGQVRGDDLSEALDAYARVDGDWHGAPRGASSVPGPHRHPARCQRVNEGHCQGEEALGVVLMMVIQQLCWWSDFSFFFVLVLC